MNRKALVVTTALELLAVIFLILMMIEVATAFGESDTVIKINLAEDLRMMTDTLAAVPGEAVVEYPRDVSQFIIILTQTGVMVFKEGEMEIKQVVRTFYLPEGFQAVGAAKNAARVCLEKKKKMILLRACSKEETTWIRVPPELGEPGLEGIYTCDAGILATELYYRYFNGNWQWSPDKEKWMPTTTTIVSGGEYDGDSPVKENVEIIQYLNQYNPDPNQQTK